MSNIVYDTIKILTAQGKSSKRHKMGVAYRARKL